MVLNYPVSDYASVLDQTTQFVDVREPAELADGTLAGVVNIPLSQLTQRVNELDRNRRVVLVCRSGGRSGQAAEFLAAAGYPDVVNLSGGMLDYASAH